MSPAPSLFRDATTGELRARSLGDLYVPIRPSAAPGETAMNQTSRRGGALTDAERQILRRTGVEESTYLEARAVGEADPPRQLPPRPLAPALNHQYPGALSRAELDICERAGIEPAEYLAAQRNP